MNKRAIMILAAVAVLSASPAISADTTPEHTAIRERNTKDVKKHVEDVADYLESRVRFNVREECKMDRLNLDIATCNRISGVDRYFTKEQNNRLKGVRE